MTVQQLRDILEKFPSDWDVQLNGVGKVGRVITPLGSTEIVITGVRVMPEEKKYQLTLSKGAAIAICEAAITTFAQYAKSRDMKDVASNIAEVGLTLIDIHKMENDSLAEAIRATLTLANELISDARTP